VLKQRELTQHKAASIAGGGSLLKWAQERTSVAHEQTTKRGSEHRSR